MFAQPILDKANSMLELKCVEASYVNSQILFGVDLHLAAGEVITLLGRNGMGKTTTVRCITGQLPLRAGTVIFQGHRIDHWPSYRICQAGIGLVPEGRQIFPNLSVRENLMCNGVSREPEERHWTLDRVLELFPRLAERLYHRGNNLSGGEQQMVAIGRALMTNPKLLILDEATEGLAPLVREEIWECIIRLKQAHLSILLIDKNLERLLEFADRHFVISKGRIAWSGSSIEFLADPTISERYLEISSIEEASDTAGA
jgi:branched-chain amino acid transport system ATP-binding protein